MRDLIDRLLERGWIVSALFGALVFLVVVGPGLLDVTNVAWAYHQGDISAVQTGWTYYRYSPWADPIASNPGFGMDFGGSILFSDAVPLMAIIFKALSPLLPETFQYLGLWVFISFVLQGVFGWILMSRMTTNPAVRILGACVFSLTPLYAYRVTSCTHMSLTAHWLVLAGLCLCLPPQTRRPWLWWSLVLAASAFVHVYLFAMVAALWCADVARRAYLDIRRTWIEPIGIAALLAALVLGSGVWSGPAGEFQGGFGWFKMNVFAPIDPNAWIDSAWGKWSFLLPDIPNWPGDYEGFAYLGLGGIILMALAAWRLPAGLKQLPLNTLYPYAPLVLALVGMGIFALSQNVTFATTNFYLWWPSPLQKLGELFRATGRFIWPLYYFAFIAALFLLTRTLSPRAVIAALAGVIVIQAVDLTPGWSKDGDYLRVRGGMPKTTMTSLFWDEAATHYKAVRIVPHRNNHPRFVDIAVMAFSHGMQTDAAYLSRTSTPATAASKARVEHGIATGEWPTDTLFLLDEDTARRASAKLDRTHNALVRVDDYIALAPGWQGCADCGAVAFE